MNPKGTVEQMLAIELLAGRAAASGDSHMLGVCAEAWERGGWCISFFWDVVFDSAWRGHGEPYADYAPTRDHAEDLVRDSRHRKNRAKLRHQADALLSAITLMPLDVPAWQRLKYGEGV